MSIAVIYWSGTGNTEMMAKAIAEGAGAELFSVSDFSGDITAYDKVAFGCPAMGDEILEEDEFEPFFTSVEDKLSGKQVALFGSYDWGDGEWMRKWAERTAAAGADVFTGEGLIVNNTPDDEALDKCRAFGEDFAK
ncbi:MAG: flavodoxin [Oscillospiraceae bacterium]|nr:flavodoxin [Oscillospiraceae bacterium]MBQ8978863.1 flavodoxin [Oscillospiraceae bacterium]